MAVNKVVYNNATLIDLTDSNLTNANQLPSGVSAYSNSGDLLNGTASFMQLVDTPTENDILITDENGQAIDSGVGISQVQRTLTSGTGIDITNNVISNIAPMFIDELGVYSSATPINADLLNGHDDTYFQKVLSAGSGITIANDTVSLNLTLSNYLVRQRLQTTVTMANADNSWTVSANKSGYTPIMANVFYSNSSTSMCNAEAFSMTSGSFSCRGYLRNQITTGTATIYVDVLWMKN